MTVVAGKPHSTVHDVETLTDDALRDLFAYPETPLRPRLRANFIASIDGAVTLDGSGRKLGTPTDRRVFGRLREVADVVMVGATTSASKPYADIQMTAEARTWRLSHGLSPELPVAVVSGRGVIPTHLLDNLSPPPVVLVSAEANPKSRRALHRSGACVVELPGARITSAAIREALGRVGLTRVDLLAALPRRTTTSRFT
jgi:5-amino-6-(5-phosphoribosylamino)uracil reductase